MYISNKGDYLCNYPCVFDPHSPLLDSVSVFCLYFVVKLSQLQWSWVQSVHVVWIIHEPIKGLSRINKLQVVKTGIKF